MVAYQRKLDKGVEAEGFDTKEPTRGPGAAMGAEDVDVGSLRNLAAWEGRRAAHLAQKARNREKAYN